MSPVERTATLFGPRHRSKTVRARLNSVAVTPLEPLLFNSEQSTVDRITAIQRIRPQGAP